MISVEDLRDTLISKESITMAQITFMKEFNEVYQESDKRERDFLERAVDQIFRKYYYSVVEPGTHITPANIIFALSEGESAGSNVFVPRIELVKDKGALSKINSTLHFVNSENHYMVSDFETVLEICKGGLKVDKFGIPDEGERKKFEGKLFLNDRNYLNIIVLVAISMKYVQIYHQGKKITAVTTKKSKEIQDMTVNKKLRLVAEGIVYNCVDSLHQGFPQLKDVLTKDRIWQLVKNPSKFGALLEAVNEKIGFNLDPVKKMLLGEDIDVEHVKDMLINSSSGALILSFSTQMDIYFFTPLGYYLQLIKPIYNEVYNITFEIGSVFNALPTNFHQARNMLFSIPMGFDLTPLGDEILLDGRELKKTQKVSKKYKDASFLKSFAIREMYLEAQLEEFYNDYEDEGDFEELTDEDDDNIIDMFNYKRKGNSVERGKNSVYTQSGGIKSETHNELYVFRVKNYYAKTIWIQLEIGRDSTLEDLHQVIWDEFNLEWGHLYSFYISGKFWDQTTEVCHPDADGTKKANSVKIGSLRLGPGSKFVYLYDYGEEHRFEIECKQVAQAEKDVRYPRVVKKSKRFIDNHGDGPFD